MCFLRINSAAVWNNGELEVLLDTSSCQFMSETFGQSWPVCNNSWSKVAAGCDAVELYYIRPTGVSVIVDTPHITCGVVVQVNEHLKTQQFDRDNFVCFFVSFPFALQVNYIEFFFIFFARCI